MKRTLLILAAFAVSAAMQGEPGDQIVEQGGATVYLDRCAEPIIEQINMILDARGSAAVRS